MKRNNFHLFSLVVFALLFSVLSLHQSHAALTKQLSYQGRLNSASGQPVANGTYTVVFSLYNVSSGGSALWTETQNVTVENGGFSAYLGSVTALTLPFNEDYFLGIKVGSDPEMTPRMKLAVVGTAAFALESDKLQGKAASDFALSTHTHTVSVGTSEITDGSITASDIDATAVQKRVTGTCAGQVLVAINQDGTVTCEADDTGGGGGGTPASTVTSIAATSVVGTSTNFAREDHAHDIPSGLITNKEIAATAGIATSKLSGTVTSISGNGLGSLATLNAVSGAEIQDSTITFADIASNSCASGQVIEYNGTAWVCGTDDVGGGGITASPTSTQTIIAGNSSTTPLALKAATTPTADIFDVQDNAGTSLVKVNNLSNLLVGNPSNTGNAKLSVQDGTLGNVIYTKSAGGGNAIYATSTGTGDAGIFEVNNISSAATAITGITTGTGNFLVLSQGGANKVVVNNAGNVLVGNPVTITAKVSAYDTGTANHAGYFEINNASSLQYAVFGSTNGSGNAVYGYTTGTGNAGEFQIINASNASDAIKGTTTGTGKAGEFQIINATNASPIILGNTTGTGSLLQLQQGGVDKFVVDNTGAITVGGAANTIKTNPSAAQTIQPSADVVPLIIKDDAAATANLFDVQNNAGTSLVQVAATGNLLVGSPAVSSAKVSAYDTGTANHAGYFQISNASSSKNPVYGTTNGAGAAVYGYQTGADAAGKFEIVNAANAGSAVIGNTTGTGYAGYFQIVNAANASSAVIGDTNGTGNAVYGYTTGTGQAGSFQIANASNASAILLGNTTGTGNLLQLQKSGVDKVVVANSGNVLVGNPVTTTAKVSAEETGTTNNAGYFWINNAANANDALTAATTGDGRAGDFEINNAANTSAAIYGTTNGTGYAGYFEISNAANGSAGVYSVITQGTGPAVQADVSAFGTGSAGWFQILNASNSSSLLTGETLGTGNLLQLKQNGANKFIVDNTGSVGLVKNAVQPSACGAGNDGYVALTSAYRLCVCKNGAGWVFTNDGTTACTW